MAGQDQGKVDLSFKAGADLSAAQYKFVKLSADDTVVIVSGTTDNVIGVLQNKPNAAGKAATVRVFGKSKVVSGATIAAGAEVSSDANAVLKGAATTERIRGTCLVGGNSGDLTECFINPSGARMP